MGEVRVSLTALLLMLASPAWAQDEAGYAALLDKAKAAITSGDYKGARTLLAQAEAAAPASGALIQEKDLARLSFYKGAIEWRNGDKDTAALNHWRDAIVVSQDFQPEADVLPESDAQDVYYALIGEVKGRDSVTLGLPEDPGDTMIFVDGRRMEAFDAVVLGTHFLQLRCGEGNVVGSWYTFGAPPPDYLVLCSGGAYPVVKGGKPAKAPKGPSKAELAKAEKEAAKQAALAAAAAEKAEKEAAAAAALEKAAVEQAAKAEADKAAATLAAAEKGVAEKAAADKAAADKAAATLATADKAVADKAAADTAAAATSAAATLAAADKAAAEKAAADKAAADKAAADKAAVDKSPTGEADKTAATAKAAADKAASDKAAADKAAADKAASDKAASDKAAKVLAEKPTKKPKAEKDGGGAVGWAMIAGGGAMIAGGGAINFLVVNPAWTEAEAANTDPQGVSRAEADAIVSRFNTGRYATIGLLAAGVATAGVGVFLGPLDSHVYFTPTGVGLAGRW